MSAALHTLPKKERLCGVKDIESLMKRGKYLSQGCLRVCSAPSGLEYSRILVSVPKKSFRRAVKRNLLKRRIRESYRLQKELLTSPRDIMFLYTPKEVLPFEDIRSAMALVLTALSK